jgi:signal transduction histidine kinase
VGRRGGDKGGARSFALPAPTIRLRLTVAYGLVFLITGAVLLTIGYFAVREGINGFHFREHPRLLPPFPHPPLISASQRELARDFHHQFVASQLHRLIAEYVLALGLMTLISVVAGWLLAGRALRPLRDITATARRVSSENLGERIALVGPADELKELADTFDRMLGRLDGAFASQRHFVANASHELRTPLAIMRTEVDVALADPGASAEELRGMGEAVRETVDRCEGLIEALLMLARSEAVIGREEAVDLGALAALCVTDLHARAQALGVRVQTDLQETWVRGEPHLLERMIANLIDNAIRHNQPGGYIDVRTFTAGQTVEVIVRNGGSVIEPEEVHRLAEPFRRLSRSVGGFGLGLSIVRSVAEVHGGAAELWAPADGGLEVRITMPAGAIVGVPRRQRSLTRS